MYVPYFNNPESNDNSPSQLNAQYDNDYGDTFGYKQVKTNELLDNSEYFNLKNVDTSNEEVISATLRKLDPYFELGQPS